MDVGERGYRAWRTRPACRRQRDDMVLLAHIREQHLLSLKTYGRPRMTEELKELGGSCRPSPRWSSDAREWHSCRAHTQAQSDH